MIYIDYYTVTLVIGGTIWIGLSLLIFWVIKKWVL